MKIISTFLKSLILVCLMSFTSKNYVLHYTLTYSNSVYTVLDSETSINISDAAWNGKQVVDLPFTFSFFSHSFNKIYINFKGLSFTDSGTDCIIYGTYNYYPESESPSMSPISYSITGNSPNMILKIEYKNIKARLIDSTKDYTINNQIWLYETSNKIEYHFGTNSISDSDMNELLVGMVNGDDNQYIALQDTAIAPILNEVLDPGSFNGIKPHPVNGQVYILTP